MRDQRISDAPERDAWSEHRALLDLLVESHPTLWSLVELARTLATGDQARSGDEPPLEDALQDLYGAGLVHRSGQFVFATRAAVEADRLGM